MRDGELPMDRLVGQVSKHLIWMPKNQIRNNTKNGEEVSKNIVHPDNISIGYADDTFYTSAGACVALAKGAARMRKVEAANQERRQKLKSKKRNFSRFDSISTVQVIGGRVN
jgi:hypothetical protein